MNSLSRQTFQEFSVIVVSDCYIEKTPEILKNTQTKYVFAQHNLGRGPAYSRNYGLRLADGHYIIFLDDDDSFEPHHLETAAHHIQRLSPQISYTDFNVVDEIRTENSIIENQKTAVTIGQTHPSQLFIQNSIPNNCLIFSRELLMEQGFDTDLILFEDWDFLLGCLASLPPIHYIPAHTANVHKTPRNIGDRRGARNDDKLVEATLTIYRNNASPNKDIQLARQAKFLKAGISLDLSFF